MSGSDGNAASKGVPTTALHRAAETPEGLSLRALISAVPVLGSMASVLIESHLTTLAIRRAEVALDQMSRRLAAVENEDRMPSNALLELALMRSTSSPEVWRPRLIANLVFLGSKNDPGEVLRRHLIEIASTLTVFELALLVHVEGITDESAVSEITRYLREVDVDNDQTLTVRQYSFERLQTFKLLIASTRTGHTITDLGRHIVQAMIA